MGPLQRVSRWLAAGLLAVALPVLGGTADPGEALYRHGVLASGRLLQAQREGSGTMQGEAAACVNCHRSSGLGSREGRNTIPPIAGRYLFRPRASDGADPGLPYVETMRGDREPYTDATLARAIRDGVDAQGKPLSFLMPQFALGDADMAALIAYLKRLDPGPAAGVGDTVLHFATIVTPDADPQKRRGMLDVLNQYVADKNAFPLGPVPRLRSTRNMMFMVNRRWELHVWELAGPPATWQAQLDRKLAAQPVFAVLSGLGGRTWAPVHAFCEHARLPCLFPNVDAPPATADHDFYSLYFSRGVQLEAGLLAKRLLLGDGDGPAVRRVRQIYRAGDSGEAGAQALAALLKGHGLAVSSQPLPPGPAGGEIHAGAAPIDAAPDEAVVLWLRPADLAALRGEPPAGPVYVSGLVGGLEHAPLPPAWRSHARMAYPVDLPDKRRVRVDYALGWFAIRHIPLVADQVQADTYLACGLLSETLSHMADTFVRDYLVERMQDMLEHRVITGYYPRLALANGQRFASKGGYLVRFADERGMRVVADQEWQVP